MDKSSIAELSYCRHLGVVSTVSGLAVSVHTPRRAAASGDSGGGRCSYRRSNALRLFVSLHMTIHAHVPSAHLVGCIKPAAMASRLYIQSCSALLTRRSGSGRLHDTTARKNHSLHEHQQPEDSPSNTAPLGSRQANSPSNVHSLHIAPCSKSTSATSGCPTERSAKHGQSVKLGRSMSFDAINVSLRHAGRAPHTAPARQA